MDQREIARENKKYFKLSKNKNTVYHNLWNAAKVVFRRKFIAFCICMYVHIYKYVYFWQEQTAKINKASILEN